jgi:predicted transcriptional regulator
MSQVEIQLSKSPNFLLPSGKELTLHDVLHFCYGLSETEVEILMTLIRSSPKLAYDLEQELQLSKAIVNRSLNKLLSMGLVKRTKDTEKKRSRPKYVYYIPSFEELKDKLVKEIEDCTNSIRNLISMRFNPSTY